MSSKISEHFSWGEVTFSETAIRAGIDNTPPDSLLANIQRMANFMENVRFVLSGRPIHITSWYRSPEVNRLIGGSKNSAHMKGLACDFVCSSLGEPLQVARKIAESNLDFDQVILEGNRWVHIGLAEGNRRQLLTAFFPGPRYYQGLLEDEPKS